jgi:tRNA(Ile)-lysidine synthase
MSLLSQFISFISKEKLFSTKDFLLLAVSGGVDSVVLCELCHQAGFDFVIAHCNFQLRGPESDRDEAFVKELGRQYEKEVVVRKFDTEAYAAKKRVSIQVAARELRYEWFFELIDNDQYAISNRRYAIENKLYAKGKKKSGVDSSDSVANKNDSKQIVHSQSKISNSERRTPDYLLTAHHLDDNIETLLMNFFKGTGIAGMRGMLPKQDKLIRPLLFAKKEELVLFGREKELTWVEDSSNNSDTYSRNYFRHQLIPLVQKIYPTAVDNLANNLHRFNEIELLYQQSIQVHKNKLLEQRGDEVHIPVLKLKKTVPLETVVFEIIRDFGFSPVRVHEVIHLLDTESGKYIASPTHRIIKNRNWLIIAPLQTMESAHILIESCHDCSFADGILQFRKINIEQGPISTENAIATIDALRVQFPLLLRKWKQGDYFYPLGMKKKKKLSRFFTDQKLSKTEKEKTWVLEMNKKIVWVVGYRIDDRFKIAGDTTQALEITLKSL